MKNLLIISCATLIFATACNNKDAEKETMTMTPPAADKIAKNLEMHGDVRADEYYWLNDRENEEVIDYLERENDYYDKMTAHTKDFKTELFEEMKVRIIEDDASVPYNLNGYYYVTRFETGKVYPIFSG
jgi:oligopeptidase B